MKPEKAFETKVKDYLNSRGAYVVKHFANMFTQSGVPDLLVTIHGCFVGVEIKATHGKPSALQRHHIDKIRKSGGIAIVLYPEQFEQFKELIDLVSIKHFIRAYVKQFDFDK